MRPPAVLQQKVYCGNAAIPPGGGKIAGATIWLPRSQRVLIGVDDTDTREEGATWTLVHNIAKAVEDEHSVYLSHTIVQLFPVAPDEELREPCRGICHDRTGPPDGAVPRTA